MWFALLMAVQSWVIRVNNSGLNMKSFGTPVLSLMVPNHPDSLRLKLSFYSFKYIMSQCKNTLSFREHWGNLSSSGTKWLKDRLSVNWYLTASVFAGIFIAVCSSEYCVCPWMCVYKCVNQTHRQARIDTSIVWSLVLSPPGLAVGWPDILSLSLLIPPTT